MSRWLWFLSGLTTRLWLRASLYGIVAVVTALVSIYARRFIPENVPQKIGADAVDGILNILASSMLAVTIFSVSTMVSAYSAATSNVTPRATKLLIEDKLSQNALSTFIGTFIYSIVGIIALKTGAYGDSGRLVLFVVTIAVIAVIIVTLLRWIEYLARLGRVSETVERVENVTAKALKERLETPYLGGTPLLENSNIPSTAIRVLSEDVSYIQHIDISLLSKIAEDHDGKIYVQAMPGKLVAPHSPLAFVTGIEGDEAFAKIRKAFISGRERSFRQDPRYGFAVLSEIASRALSPAVNDAGTAIYVISVGLRVLTLWEKRQELSQRDNENNDIKYPLVHVPPLKIEDLYDDFFSPIERDGASNMEVSIRLQKAFIALHRTNDETLQISSAVHSALSLKRSLAELKITEDREKLSALASTIS